MVPLKKIKLGFEISTSLHDFAVASLSGLNHEAK